MSYEQWLSCILGRVRAIASKEYQKETWKAGGNLVSSPDEVYQALMEDCTADVFFETYGGTLTEEQRILGHVKRFSIVCIGTHRQ
jgi:trans-aconitate methyltransferase